MIRFLADRLVGFLKASEAVPTDNDSIDIYRYGIEITISTIFNIAIIAILSAVYGSLLTGAIFLLIFIPIRQYAGGYHAKTYLKCNTVFAITFSEVFWLTEILHNYISLYVIEALMIFCFIIIYNFSPIENEHKPIDDEEKRQYKKLSLIILSIIALAAIAAYTLSSKISICITLTTVSVITLMIISLISERLKRKS